MAKKQVIFLSIDTESNGPCAGLHSMLSIGLAGFDTTGQIVFEYEANLQPIPNGLEDPETIKWWAQDKNKEAWKHIHQDQRDPTDVFTELKTQIIDLQSKYKVRTVGWPINYDWQWLNYYFHRYIGSNPLGHSALCIRTYAFAMHKKADSNDQIDIDQYTDPRFKHTHKALDDAKEQGAIFINMYRKNLGSA
jgi:hypothetical protein